MLVRTWSGTRCALVLAAGLAVVTARGEHAPKDNGRVVDGPGKTVSLSARPCVFQSTDSPSEGTSLDRVAPPRIVRGIPSGLGNLLDECRELSRQLQETKARAPYCDRVFIGGHGVSRGVGVGDLFFVASTMYTPDGKTDRAALDDELRQLQSEPPLPPALAQRAARNALIVPTGRCWLGPQDGSPQAAKILEETLDCLGSLVDKTSPYAGIVLSSCGPGKKQKKGAPEPAIPFEEKNLHRKVCAGVLADAVGLPITYSNSSCASEDRPGAYDVCEAGHTTVRPSY